MKFIRGLAAEKNIDVILPVGNRPIGNLIEHQDMFEGVARLAFLPDALSLKTAGEKWLLAEFMRECDIPFPETVRYRPGVELNAKVGFPVLIKPAGSGGGEGIELISNNAELEQALIRAKPGRDYIIQAYVDGYDIDCSVLCKDGNILAYTIQRSIIEDRNRYLPPKAVEFLYHAETFRIVEKLVGKLRWNGVAHIDLRYDSSDGRIKVIEVNPRFWASLLHSTSVGVNFPHLSVMSTLGLEFPVPKYRFGRYGAISVALKTHLKKSKYGYRIPLSNTDLSFLLRDPLPGLFRLGGRVSSRMKNRWPVKKPIPQ